MNYLQLAIRNVFRHKKRSIVTIFTISLGFVAIGVLSGMINNIYSRLKGQAIVIEKLGHITFAKEGYFENSKMEPAKYLWEKEEMEDILRIIKDNPEVKIATPRLSMFGIVSNGKSSTLFITEAVVPEDDKILLATKVDGRIESDGVVSLDTDSESKNNVAIGSELSKNLGLEKGEYITLLTNTKDGMVNALDVDIEEIFNTGNPATNDKYVLTDFSTAQDLYDTEGAERVVVILNESEKADEVRADLLTKLSAAGHKMEAQTWSELSLFYGKITAMFGIIFKVLTVIITVVGLLTLVNTLQIAIAERTREIGTMRAIGMLRKNVITLFCSEAFIMSMLGCLIAIPILFGIAGILKVLHITFVPPVASSAIPIELIFNPNEMLAVFILFGVSTLLAAYLVSRKIADQKVVNSLMHIN